MNATEITNGGLVSTTTFWEVSIPLVVASIIVPVAFSGLLIRLTIKVVRYSYQKWLTWRPFIITVILMAFNVASAIMGGRPLFWIVWALNLLYTFEFVLSIPANYRDLIFAFERLVDAKAARKSYTSRDPSTASESRSAIELELTRGPDASRDSSETESSWVTANPRVPEGLSETEGSGAADPGSSIANSSDLYQDVSREKLLKTHWLRRMHVFAISAKAVITLGGLALGAAFLALDVIHPKARGLSLYHSFALWMSLVKAIEAISLMGLEPILSRVIVERRQVKKAAAKRCRHISHSEGGISVARDGVV